MHGQNSQVPAQHGAQILVGIVTPVCARCTAVGGGPEVSPEPARAGPGARADLLRQNLLRDVCSAHMCFLDTSVLLPAFEKSDWGRDISPLLLTQARENTDESQCAHVGPWCLGGVHTHTEEKYNFSCHGYRPRRTEQLENTAHPYIIMANDVSIFIKEMLS